VLSLLQEPGLSLSPLAIAELALQHQLVSQSPLLEQEGNFLQV